jgi:uncharacterized protein YndB with AHSA1/START domain
VGDWRDLGIRRWWPGAPTRFEEQPNGCASARLVLTSNQLVAHWPRGKAHNLEDLYVITNTEDSEVMSNPKITYVIHIATTAEKLWQALTSATALKANWGDIQSEWIRGAQITEVDDSGKVLWRGEVLRSEPGRLLSYTMDGDEPTEVTVELGPARSDVAPSATIVRLELTQTGFKAQSTLLPECARAWSEILSSLKTYLETGRPLGFAWKH